MKCNKCGTLLEEGSNVCPNCQNIMTYDDIEEVEELEPTVNENMAPPSLEVNNENLTEGIKDIASNNDDSLYEVDPDEAPKDINVDENVKKDNVDIAIPSVTNVVENADAVTGVVSEQDIEDKKLKFKINLKGSVPALYVIVIGFATLIVGMLLGKALFSTSYISSGCRSSEIKTKLVSDGSNNETYLSGLIFKIPTTYIYDKQQNGLVVYDQNGTVKMYIRLDYGSYDNIAIAKTSIKETIKLQNTTVNSIEEKKLKDGGEAYIVIEAGTTDGKNRLIAFRKYNDEKVFYIEIIDATNNYNEDALSVVDDILNNVSESEGTTIEDLSLYDISSLLIASANEYKALISNEK